MLTGPNGFDAALAARANMTVRAAVALPNGGGVLDLAAAKGIAKSLTIRRDLSGDLPDAATLVEGSTAASVDIDGDGRVAGAPHPLRSGDAEAWLNAPVEILAGYDGLRVPVFKGTMREFGFSHGARSLSLTARDGADVMKAPVSIPFQGSQANRTVLGAPYRHPINTAAVITNVLHKNDIRLTPRPREDCLISVPGVGGYVADIGWVGVFGQSAPTAWLTSGKFGPTPAASGESVVAFPAKAAWAGSSRRIQIEFFFEHVTNRARPNFLRVSTNPGSGSIFFEVADNQLTAYVSSGGGQAVAMPAQPLSGGWHHIVLSQEVIGSVAWSYTNAEIDGVRVVTNRNPTGSPGTLTAGYLDRVTFSPGGLQAINVYVYNSSTTPYESPSPSDRAFVPEADVDRGKLDLTGMPEIEGRESWALLREIADAEFGMVGFGESGRFFFRNRDTLNAPTIPVAEWGVDLLETLEGSVAVDSVRTRVTARVPERLAIWSGRGAETEASTAVPSLLADQVYELAPRIENKIILTGSTPFLPEAGRVTFITAAGQAWDTAVGLVMCADPLGNTYDAAGMNDWARVRMIGPTTMELTVYNSSYSARYICWPGAWVSASTPFGFTKGSPAVWVNGYSLPDADQTRTGLVNESNAAAAALWGDRVWDMGENVWRQNVASVQALAQSLLAGMSTPRAELSSVTLPADPRWQIGDPVRLTDWEGRLPSIMARITSIELTLSLEVEGGMVGVYGLRQMLPTVAAPTIVSWPVSQSVTLGSTVELAATVTGGPTPAVQWQVNGVDIPGATMLRYSFTPTLADSGKAYKIVARNASGVASSPGATLTVTSSEGSMPKVLTQTGPTMTYPDAFADLSSSAAGTPEPTVQWQRSANGSTGWADVPGATNPTLRVDNEYNDATVYFRAVWSNPFGTAITGNYGVFFASD